MQPPERSGVDGPGRESGDLPVGAVVAGRFAVEATAGAGGMGTVYRARDAVTGARVALKVLRDVSSEDAERFARESSVLAELAHPGIVRHVAHGVSGGAPYLAMEWLEGDTLSRHLDDGRPSADDTIRLLLGAATGLAAAHRHGVVHRDIKPSNLFVVDGDLSRIVLLDFGVARWGSDRQRLTSTGTLIGTPAYMAPEQARGSRDVDPRADVFALGCVAYRCLTGVNPFEGDNLLGTLFRILFEDPPPPTEVTGGVPPGLDDLVRRMLSKDAALRPPDGLAVAAELQLLAEGLGDGPSAGRARGLTGSEQQLLAVVLARPGPAGWPGGDGQRELADVARRFDGRLEQVADGSALLLFSGARSASDQARRAAGCALAVRDLIPDAAIAVASGRATLEARLPVGEVIDRVVVAADRLTAGKISLDEATAGLLDARFAVVTAASGGHLLRGARDEVDRARTVLGKATPLVGRERELAMLEGLLAECTADSVARAVIVTAPAGGGKTRLRQELVRRAVRLDERLEVMIGRGDPLRNEAPLALLGELIRRVAGFQPSDDVQQQRDRLVARIGRHLPPARRGEVTPFLGELAGVPFAVDLLATLRAAQGDGVLRFDHMRTAWLEWLTAECEAHPLLLVMEDVHWCDRPSVELVDAALRHLGDRRFMVLGLARPEVRQRFPDLWERRNLDEVRLAPLQRKAATRLVRDLLGAEPSDDTVARIVERSTGNPLFLEELARAVAEGHAGSLPDSVLLMLQARLDGLEPEARRVLRAASVFGESFSSGGVHALVGPDRAQAWVQGRLAELVDGELIEARLTGGPGDTGTGELFAFRHVLIRDATYATLTGDDRALGHRLAAGWLETRSAEPAVLAEHFARGDQPERALIWFQRGAEDAVDGGDLASAADLASRGLALGAAGETAGALHLVLSEAHNWRREPDQAIAEAELALALLPRGARRWFKAADELFMALGKQRLLERARAILLEGFVVEPVDRRANNAKISFLARSAITMIRFGSPEMSRLAVKRLDDLAGDPRELEPLVAARLYSVHALLARAEGDAAACLAAHAAGRACLEEIADFRTLCYHLVSYAGCVFELGEADAAVDAARRAVSETERLELPAVLVLARYCLGTLLVRLGRTDEGRALLEEVCARSGDESLRALALASLAEAAVHDGQFDQALAEAARATELLPDGSEWQAMSRACAARAHLGLHQVELAEAAIGPALAGMRRTDGFEVGEGLVRLIQIEVLEAAGKPDEARGALQIAVARLAERAARIQEPWRRGFLTAVAEHVRTLRLAVDLGLELPPVLRDAPP